MINTNDSFYGVNLAREFGTGLIKKNEMTKKLIDFELLKLNYEFDSIFSKKKRKNKQKIFFSDEVPPLNLSPLARDARVGPLPRPTLVTPLVVNKIFSYTIYNVT